MDDKRLLDAAAKSAGYKLRWLYMGQDPQLNGQFWNPLTDDGDALRLAVKLNLHEAIKMAHRLVSGDRDFYAATRLSIVRAAASLQEPQESRDV